jgi:hypothetical protein
MRAAWTKALSIPSAKTVRSFRAVETAVRSALARSPLTGDPKTELLFGAKRLALGIRSFRNLPNRGAVYRLVPSALFVGLRASLQSDEIDSLIPNL